MEFDLTVFCWFGWIWLVLVDFWVLLVGLVGFGLYLVSLIGFGWLGWSWRLDLNDLQPPAAGERRPGGCAG